MIAPLYLPINEIISPALLLDYAVADATRHLNVQRIGEEHVTYDHEELERTKRTLLEESPFLQNSPITSWPPSKSRSNHERESTNAEQIAALLQMIENREEEERLGGLSSRRPPDAVHPSSTLSSSLVSSLAPSISRQECAFCVRRQRLEVIGYGMYHSCKPSNPPSLLFLLL